PARPAVPGPAGQAAGLSVPGCSGPGDAVDVAATFPVLAGLTDRYAVPARTRSELMPSALRGRWHPLGWLLGSGGVLAWFAQLVGASLEELESEAAAAGGSDGLVAVPYGSEERPGVFVGLTPRHTRGHLYRALLEGLACECALLRDDLAAEGVRFRPPNLPVGGASGSRPL